MLLLLLQGSPRNGSCKRGEVAAQAVDFDPTRPIARVVLAIFEVVPTYARMMDAAGDPVPLLHAAGFVDVAVAGSLA